MYAQVTTRCNMHCIHCGANCTSVGEDMSLEVFKESCILANKHGDDVTLGGGEPTLNKDFWDMVTYAVDHCIKKPGLVTNGTDKETSLYLAELAKAGILYCGLSVDKYHDLSMVDPAVIKAFTKEDPDNHTDLRNLRDVSAPGRRLVNVGRAAISYKLGLLTQEVSSIRFCCGLQVDPDGTVYHCGCKTMCYGTVFNNTIPKNYYRVTMTCDVIDTDWRDYLVDNDLAWRL